MMYLFQHEDFPQLIGQAAAQLRMPAAFIEKDYWVTYVLYRLRKEKVDDFIFKGGTSLTKAWGLLDRFSEDIDLLFVPHEWRTHQGKMCNGRTPLETFVDGIQVFKEKAWQQKTMN